ncbi:formate-dependent phosphoribosylglycinamide formyltransferase [Desulfurobacterium sp. TC5-1]|uniref:formate-dependent phosphoribosylglycinamide formyltransferase n=1 Tax=Desulfurobacterium sp. TC5-1 TaxID=1158318 RepID=UPI0003B6A197|nr:formate-dependent phosphoribosylglycinamide formyltransferase [Desulfurobacterium sp. TC5-1]
MLGTPLLKNADKIMLLGSGELGKEVTIEAQRLGIEVIAVDRYQNAPAMQVAHRSYVIDMLDGNAIRAIVEREKPELIVPEIEAIHTPTLLELEKEGYTVIPTARATRLTMDREGIRRVAAEKLGLKTAKYAFADTMEELAEAVKYVGLPAVIKPIMSSSGKGQSIIKTLAEIEEAWKYAQSTKRGMGTRVIVEEFIEFDTEITLLTIRAVNGTFFCEPIGHLQIKGDYNESWQPAGISEIAKKRAQEIAKKITDELGGLGIFGVELFIKGDDVIFSEVSPRPHDTGMVTMITQDMSEFELHIRAILGFNINPPKLLYPAGASKVILSDVKGWNPGYTGVEEAMAMKNVKVRLFGKPNTKPGRRMGVVLAAGGSVEEARKLANEAAAKIKVVV